MKKLLVFVLLLVLYPVAFAADLSAYTGDELQALLSSAQVEYNRRTNAVTAQKVYDAMYAALEKPPVEGDDDILFKRRGRVNDPHVFDTSMPGVMFYPLTGRMDYIYSDNWHRLEIRQYKGLLTLDHIRSYASTFLQASTPDDIIIPADDIVHALITDAVITVPGDRLTTVASEAGYSIALVRSVDDDGNLRYDFIVSDAPDAFASGLSAFYYPTSPLVSADARP